MTRVTSCARISDSAGVTAVCVSAVNAILSGNAGWIAKVMDDVGEGVEVGSRRPWRSWRCRARRLIAGHWHELGRLHGASYAASAEAAARHSAARSSSAARMRTSSSP
jgi:hypothetical protein